MARVLVIDDESGVRRGVARILERMGHEVEQAEDGVVAMRLFDAEPHDLVVTDINMPEMDGIEVILKLLHGDQDVRIIAMSGGGQLPKELLLVDADLLGAVATIPKPFEVEGLMAAVTGALGS